MPTKAKIENLPVAKPYRKPALMKGPVLTGITAAPAVSGGIPSDGVTCWVARAAFGEADLRWMIFRAWLLDDAPRWLLQGYLSHGEWLGARVARSDLARNLVRRLMMPAVRRKLRG